MKRFDRPFDPNENVDYYVNWEPDLSPDSDTIENATFDIPSAEASLGLEVHDVTWDTVRAKVWLSVANPETNAARLVGREVPITCTITTAGNRVMQQTVLLKIEQN